MCFDGKPKRHAEIHISGDLVGLLIAAVKGNEAEDGPEHNVDLDEANECKNAVNRIIGTCVPGLDYAEAIFVLDLLFFLQLNLGKSKARK